MPRSTGFGPDRRADGMAVPFPIPGNEIERLRALQRDEILDTPPEAEFDDLARLAAGICGTPAAFVTLVDANRQWFKAAVGLDVREVSRDVAFCAQAILQPGVMVVPDLQARRAGPDSASRSARTSSSSTAG